MSQSDVRLLVARQDGIAVGCVALVTDEDGAAKLKGLYVSLPARSKFNRIMSESAALLNESTFIVDGGTTVDYLIALDLAITEALKRRLSYAIRYNDSPPVGTQSLGTL